MKRQARGVPWIVTHERDLGWECLRCREKTALKLPVRISVWLAAAKAFLAAVHGVKVTLVPSGRR